ncbi:MAG: gamma-glutamyltransferase [Ahrensia sp.]|nr:gamma-glutamyltransferase [Ahrensia sp.]
MRNLELPGRSPVPAMNGMAATSHALSSQTAIDVLKSGGNALDGAIAACAVQCVVEPGSTGIGGDCFALFSKGGGSDVIGYNGSGRAPAAASLERLREMGVSELTRTSPHSVIIPGAIDAWCRLNADHGVMPLAELLQPAIDFARHGYPVSSRVHRDWTANAEHLASNPALAKIFLPVPQIGDVHRQPGLADAMEMIGKEGREAFYEGVLAQEMVETLQGLGGLHTLEDFASAAGNYVTPITTQYRGNTIVECPPQGQGVIALLLMNIMARGDVVEDMLSAERIHLELEACRRGYAARSRYLADPDMSDVPVEAMLSDDYAQRLFDDIDPAAARHPQGAVELPEHRDTVYISVVDKDRNACSFINTLFWGWGSGITTPRHGIVLTNRGEGFVLEEGHPNCLAPGKRPLHTIIPAMVQRDGKTIMSFGVMGGEYQAMGHLQFLTRYLDYGLDIQEAQDAPRWMVDPFTGAVEIESTVATETVDALRSMGHAIERAKTPIGGSQAIAIDWENGVLTGGSDPRKDGCAIGY